MTRENKRRMKNEYFEYSGKKYPAGTKFKMVRDYGIMAGTEEGIGIFKGYSTTEKHYVVEYDDDKEKYWGKNTGYLTTYTQEELQRKIIEILPGNYYVELETRKKYPKESEIFEIVAGWCLYIFIMLGTTIFNDRVGMWIAETVFFFWWRHNKLEEYSYYD